MNDISIMIVGDSISHGSSGDWTWRYRLWKHLRAHDLQIDLVGPKGTLDDIRTAQVGDDDSTYADPDFDPDHDAQWGRPYLTEKDEIEQKVLQHRPDYLLVLLGINDLFWYDTQPDQFEHNLREFLANARMANSTLRIVLGRILPTQRAADDPAFAERVADCNRRLHHAAGELWTPSSPIVIAHTDAEFVAAEHTWDGTHPNPRGEIRIAAAFADTLASWFAFGGRYHRPYPDVTDVAAEAKAPAVPLAPPLTPS